jgi:hypothetical protein
MKETMVITVAKSDFGSSKPFSFEEMIRQGWVYRDPPTKFSFEMWDYFLSLLGEGNYHVIATSEGDDWKRGQLFISPTGMQRLAEIENVPETVN